MPEMLCVAIIVSLQRSVFIKEKNNVNVNDDSDIDDGNDAKNIPLPFYKHIKKEKMHRCEMMTSLPNWYFAPKLFLESTFSSHCTAAVIWHLHRKALRFQQYN